VGEKYSASLRVDTVIDFRRAQHAARDVDRLRGLDVRAQADLEFVQVSAHARDVAPSLVSSKRGRGFKLAEFHRKCRSIWSWGIGARGFATSSS